MKTGILHPTAAPTRFALVAMLPGQRIIAADRRVEAPQRPTQQGVVKGLNGLTARVTLSAGPGVSIRQAGNGPRISAQPVYGTVGGGSGNLAGAPQPSGAV